MIERTISFEVLCPECGGLLTRSIRNHPFRRSRTKPLSAKRDLRRLCRDRYKQAPQVPEAQETSVSESVHRAKFRRFPEEVKNDVACNNEKFAEDLRRKPRKPRSTERPFREFDLD